MSDTHIKGKRIVLGQPDASEANVCLASDKPIDFQVGGTSVFTIDSTGATHNVSQDLTTSELHVDGTADATSATDTDASVHTLGGLAVEKAVHVGTTADVTGVLSANDTTDATASTDTSASIYCAGGVAVEKSVNIGTTCTLGGDLELESGANINEVAGGGININISDTNKLVINPSDVNCHPPLYVLDTTDASSKTDSSASIHCNGGLACEKTLYADVVNSEATTDCTSNSTGALITSGGIGCAKNIWCHTLRADGGSASYRTVIGMDGAGGLAKFSFDNVGSVTEVFDYGTSRVKFLLTGEASSATSGSVQILGGCGISKKLYVNGVPNANQTAFTLISDQTLKENISNHVAQESIDRFKQLQFKRYNYNEDVCNHNGWDYADHVNNKHLGLIAQDVEAIYTGDRNCVNVISSDPDDEAPSHLDGKKNLDFGVIDSDMRVCVQELLNKADDVDCNSLQCSGDADVAGDLNVDGVFSNPSDKRSKKNIKPVDKSLDKVMKLKPCSFEYKKKAGKRLGFIAQELASVMPELIDVHERGDIKDFHSVRSIEMIPLLVKAVQELAVRKQSGSASASACNCDEEMQGLREQNEELCKASEEQRQHIASQDQKINVLNKAMKKLLMRLDKVERSTMNDDASTLIDI